MQWLIKCQTLKEISMAYIRLIYCWDLEYHAIQLANMKTVEFGKCIALIIRG